MKSDCIFCRIVAGELPASRVCEDSDTLAFLDIGPVAKGHTLVIPKAHYNMLSETPPDVLEKIIRTVRRVARAQREALGADGVNVTQANGEIAGQVVPHIHFHVIPRFAREGQIGGKWKQGAYDSPEEMNRLAEKIGAAVEDAA